MISTVTAKRSQSLSRDHRLHYSWEYRRFFDKAQVFRLKECTIFRNPNDLAHFRLGITLKARGTSIERNRVKRTIREAFRTQSEYLGAFDYNIVIAGTKKLGRPYSEKLGACLMKDLKNALSRV